MSRIFLLVLVALAGGFCAVLVDGSRHEPPDGLAILTSVTRLPGPALSAHYLEPRFRPYADFSVTVHPDLPPVGALDFVYER